MPKINERKRWEALCANSNLINIENICKRRIVTIYVGNVKMQFSTSVILNAISSTNLRYYAINCSRIAWLLAQRPDLNSHDFFRAQTLLDSHAECNACISSAAE